MNKSLFNIQEEHLKLMQEIEELNGELTSELEEQLIINEKEIENKIKSYYGLIKIKESEITLIKDEKERITSLQKTKENLIKKLKERILDACNQFGYNSKTGNKKIDYDTLKVYTVNKDKIEVNEEEFIKRATLQLELNANCTEEFMAFEYNLNNNINYEDALKLKQFCKDNNIQCSLFPNINKKRIEEVLENTEVMYCQKVNSSYINFR
jgi:hypothetical protein